MDINTVLDWIVLNSPFLIALAIFIGISIRAAKDGFISEFFSFISAMIAAVAILLLAVIIHNVFKNQRLQLVIAIILLILLGVLIKVLNLIFDPIRLVAKLPVIKIADKLLGIVMALFETIVIIWVAYCVVIIVGAGWFGDWILDCVHANPFMRLVYEYNYLYKLLQIIVTKLGAVSWLSKIGINF